MRRRTKARLQQQLAYSPLLRLIVFNVWMRLVVVAGLLLLLGIAAFCLKLWRVSPPGFLPVVRLSGLELWQARALRRTAEGHLSAGRFGQALYAWRAAWAYNPADPNLSRGLLRTILAQEPTPDLAAAAFTQVGWLLHLTRTNQADLELGAAVFEKCSLDQALTNQLGPLAETLTPALRAAYLKALVRCGDMAGFQAAWLAAEKQLPRDPELALYRAAYLAGWGPFETAGAARRQLSAAAAGGGATCVPASRLLLRVDRQLGDPDEAKTAIHHLQEAHAERLADRLVYWRLLIAAGRSAEAAQLIQTEEASPDSALEAVEFADLCRMLNLTPRGIEVLTWYLDHRGIDTAACVRCAALLVETKSWDNLRALVLRLRAAPGLPDGLHAFSHFLEGRLEFGEGRLATARAAFESAASASIDEPNLGVAMAKEMLELGFTRPALTTLGQLEAKLAPSPDYWLLVIKAADQEKDAEAVLRAARKAYALRPNDPVVLNNYAAALLICRTQAEESIKVTLQLRQRFPDRLIPTVNHAAALLLNRRDREAQALLARVDAKQLTPEEASQFYLALVELYLDLEDPRRAQAARDQINLQFLYPIQTQWLSTAMKRLAPHPAPPPASGP